MPLSSDSIAAFRTYVVAPRSPSVIRRYVTARAFGAEMLMVKRMISDAPTAE